MNQSLRDALEDNKKQIEIAEDRIRMLENGELGYEDIGPPSRDLRNEAIQNARNLIENYRKGIEIMEKMLSSKS